MSGEQKHWIGTKQPTSLEAETTAEIQHEIEKLRGEYNEEFKNFSGADPYQAGFASAMNYELLGHDDDSRSTLDVITNIFERRRKATGPLNDPISAEAIWLRSVFHDLILSEYIDNEDFNELFRDRGRFPWTYKDETGQLTPKEQVSSIDVARDWVKAIRFIIADKGSKPGGTESIAADVIAHNVQTDRVERYATAKILLSLSQEKLDHPTRFLNIGCGRDHGLVALALESYFHNKLGHNPMFNEMSVVQHIYRSGPPTDSKGRPKLTKRANELLKDYYGPIGPSAAVDLWPLSDPVTKRWAKHCSHRQMELLDKDQVMLYDVLDGLSETGVPDVEYIAADLTREVPEQLVGRKFDFVTLFTVLHQLSPGERAVMLAAAQSFLEPGGLIVIQDFVNIDEQTHELIFAENWYDDTEPFPYRTILIDPFTPDAVPEYFIHFSSGRCERARTIENSYFNLV